MIKMLSHLITTAVLAVGLPLTVVANEDLADAPDQVGRKQAQDEKVRVLIVGDSTVADFPGSGPTQGWGQAFPEFFNDQVSFLNAATSGRSSKSYRDEGRWEKALAYKPNFVFIQFGHNDQKGKGPTRETDPATTYRDNLRLYISDARAIGAKPVLVTSVARRTFRDGRISSTLGPWVDAVKAVGAEEKVPVIDLNALSTASFEAIGDEQGADLNNKEGDRTHFSPKGAKLVAGLVAGAVKTEVPELAPYLKQME